MLRASIISPSLIILIDYRHFLTARHTLLRCRLSSSYFLLLSFHYFSRFFILLPCWFCCFSCHMPIGWCHAAFSVARFHAFMLFHYFRWLIDRHLMSISSFRWLMLLSFSSCRSLMPPLLHAMLISILLLVRFLLHYSIWCLSLFCHIFIFLSMPVFFMPLMISPLSAAVFISLMPYSRLLMPALSSFSWFRALIFFIDLRHAYFDLMYRFLDWCARYATLRLMPSFADFRWCCFTHYADYFSPPLPRRFRFSAYVCCFWWLRHYAH